jgi:hypothetical protein
METIILAIDPSFRLLGKRSIAQFRSIPFAASPLDSHRRGARHEPKKFEAGSKGVPCEVEKRDGLSRKAGR